MYLQPPSWPDGNPEDLDGFSQGQNEKRPVRFTRRFEIRLCVGVGKSYRSLQR